MPAKIISAGRQKNWYVLEGNERLSPPLVEMSTVYQIILPPVCADLNESPCVQ